jgi:hypothetical protein
MHAHFNIRIGYQISVVKKEPVVLLYYFSINCAKNVFFFKLVLGSFFFLNIFCSLCLWNRKVFLNKKRKFYHKEALLGLVPEFYCIQSSLIVLPSSAHRSNRPREISFQQHKIKVQPVGSEFHIFQYFGPQIQIILSNVSSIFIEW